MLFKVETFWPFALFLSHQWIRGNVTSIEGKETFQIWKKKTNVIFIFSQNLVTLRKITNSDLINDVGWESCEEQLFKNFEISSLTGIDSLGDCVCGSQRRGWGCAACLGQGAAAFQGLHSVRLTHYAKTKPNDWKQDKSSRYQNGMNHYWHNKI